KKALGKISVILGDGRLKIAEVKEHYYDLIIMDAFSSDAIPVHLISKEAIELYLNKLTKTGIIAINISNRYINLEPVVNTLAKKLDLYILAQKDINISPEEKALGKTASHWVILTNKKENLGELVKDEKWQTIPDNVKTKLWTDDYSNILNVIKFKELKL
ncbi:MAG TPA: fused MFS/spermidine synthase, partial [Allocoleopsis sp.]